MQLGIFAKTFAGQTPHDVISAAASVGYSAVQYNMACSGLAPMPDEISATAAQDIAAAARAHRVSHAAVSGTYNMIHPDKRIREEGLARLDVLASRCHAMDTRMITVCTGTRDAGDQWRHHPENASPDAWRDLLAEMEKAIMIAERHDIVLGIEPELANVVNSAERAKMLLAGLQSSRLKIVLDAANLFERTSLDDQRRVISTAIDLLCDHIAMAHAKDRAADGAFVAAGKGVLDFDHYIASLRAAGFDGALVAHGLSAAEAPGVSHFLRNALEHAGCPASR
jgi:sugar phosphate isomerase/epimerase